MTKLVIKDADAAVTALDAFSNLCLSAAEGNYVQVAFDLIGMIAAIRNAVQGGNHVLTKIIIWAETLPTIKKAALIVAINAAILAAIYTLE